MDHLAEHHLHELPGMDPEIGHNRPRGGSTVPNWRRRFYAAFAQTLSEDEQDRRFGARPVSDGHRWASQGGDF